MSCFIIFIIVILVSESDISVLFNQIIFGLYELKVLSSYIYQCIALFLKIYNRDFSPFFTQVVYSQRFWFMIYIA